MDMENKNKAIYKYLLIFWMLAIFTLSAIPGKSIPIKINFFGWDKIAHFIIYGILAVLAYKTFKLSKNKICLVIIFCLIYGISDEIHQIFVPGRFPSIPDVIADLAGGSTAAFLMKRKERSVDKKCIK